MKLSEAIRLSGMVSPQIRGNMADEQGGTCAIGGAYLAIGQLDSYLNLGYVKHPALIWGSIIERQVNCPEYPECTGSNGVTTLDVIFHLNDVHYWTRAQIADWVASVEQIMELEAAEANQATKEPTCVLK